MPLTDEEMDEVRKAAGDAELNMPAMVKLATSVAFAMTARDALDQARKLMPDKLELLAAEALIQEFLSDGGKALQAAILLDTERHVGKRMEKT